MNKNIIILTVCLIGMVSSMLSAKEIPSNNALYKEIVSGTVLPYCTALKNGDVHAIKQYISGSLYEKNRILLEKNINYPEFLRTYYNDIEFRVEKAVENDGIVIVNIVMEYSNGYHGLGQLHLEKDVAAEGNDWKIVKFSQ